MQKEIETSNLVSQIDDFVKELADNVALHIETIDDKLLVCTINDVIIPYVDLAKKWIALGNEHKSLLCYLKAKSIYLNRGCI